MIKEGVNVLRKNYKIYAMLLLIVNFITCFIPGYFLKELWEDKGYSWERTDKYGCNMFDVTSDMFSRSGPEFNFACFVVVCWVACIGVILFSIIRNKEHKLISYAPCICLVPFFAYIIYMKTVVYNGSAWYVTYSVNWLFYVSMALQFCAAALMVAAMKGKELPFLFPKPTQKISNAEELRRYKELLDMGAITQEEFDAKKKELLNL